MTYQPPPDTTARAQTALPSGNHGIVGRGGGRFLSARHTPGVDRGAAGGSACAAGRGGSSAMGAGSSCEGEIGNASKVSGADGASSSFDNSSAMLICTGSESESAASPLLAGTP